MSACASSDAGFTLIEIIIAVTLVAVLTVTVIPRLTGFLGSRAESFKLFTGLISKTYDDAFLNDRVNYLTVHIDGGEIGETGDNSKIFQRKNGLSVLNFVKGEFRDNPRKILKYRKFPDSFKIDSVLMSSGEPVKSGTVLIPFYPGGYSDNSIIHILVNNQEQWSVRIYKQMKEPDVLEGFKTFDAQE